MLSWTVKELVYSKYKILGVPHFQRGLVWNKEDMSLLLESLFYGTPCGTLLLWKAKQTENEGIPLPGADRIEYLIIDGQQRIRCVHDVFSEWDSEEQDGEPDNEKTIWCFNLAQVPELEPLLGDKRKHNALFVKTKDPGKLQRFFYKNLIPLKILLQRAGLETIKDLIDARAETDKEEIIKKINSIGLCEKLQKIFSQEFQIIIMEERDSENGFSEIVKIYNRINSGGVRVASEEKAFATLVSIRRDANLWLQQLFEEIHPPENNKAKNVLLPRDDVLERKKERNFGFKLFIRTLVQALNFHFDFSVGAGSFSFDVLNRSEVRKALNDSASDNILKETRKILLYVRAVLQEDLYCDSLQFLSDTLSLIPVFQLLLKYPQILSKKKYRTWMRLFILKTMLRPNLTQQEIFTTVRQIRKSNRLGDCAQKILKFKVDEEKLVKRLANSNTLQDRYVLLLYWLERKENAHDFSYKNLNKGCPSSIKDQTNCEDEVFLKKEYHPEKQHIIPYSFLIKSIYHLTEETRINTHPANNIGNITYISSAENSYAEGLSDHFINMDYEGDDNLRSHFLLAKGGTRIESQILKSYSKINKTSNPSDKQIKIYEEFYICRIKLIVGGFVSWIKELEEKLSDIEIEKPQAPLFKRSVKDEIGKNYEYDNEVEDLLFNIIDSGANEDRRKRGDAEFKFNILDKEDGKQLIQLWLSKGSIKITLKAKESPLREEIIKAVATKHSSIEVLNDLPVNGNIENTKQILQIVVDFLTRTRRF